MLFLCLGWEGHGGSESFHDNGMEWYCQGTDSPHLPCKESLLAQISGETAEQHHALTHLRRERCCYPSEFTGKENLLTTVSAGQFTEILGEKKGDQKSMFFDQI